MARRPGLAQSEPVWGKHYKINRGGLVRPLVLYKSKKWVKEDSAIFEKVSAASKLNESADLKGSMWCWVGGE